MTTPSAPDLIATLSTFGELLKYLRRRARLTQQDLAVATGYSVGQICRFEQNQRLPDIPTLVALFIPALDLQDQPVLAARLLALARTARRKGSMPNVPSTNLPMPPTPLIGRAEEVAALCALVRQGSVRLLTVTGAGGIGKTRLGLAAAQALRNDFADGVWFVPLAPIIDPDLVLPAIARALELAERADQTTAALLGAALRDRYVLVLLDNCEHLLAVAPQLADLLAACSHLKLLATSRVPFHIRAEHHFPVVPLPLPSLAHPPDLAALAVNPAVALFVERTQAILPHFMLTAANAASVAAICVRLDGVPLAIELVAARLERTSLVALTAQLGQRLTVLTDGPADLPTRQRTLRNTIAWSYDLLGAPEQALLRHLGVFQGGAQRDAIAAVCCFGPAAMTALDTALATLITHNVLGHTLGGAEPRYALLETIQEYALEQVQRHDETQILRQRHAAYFLALAETAAHHLGGPQQPMLLAQLTREQDNLRTALATLRDTPSVIPLLRLCSALSSFWSIRGLLHEGRQALEAALARGTVAEAAVSRTQADAARAHALEALSMIAWLQGRYVYAHTVVEEALHLYRVQADAAGIANALHRLGAIAGYQGDYPRARALYEQSLAHRSADDQLGTARTLGNLGITMLEQGDLAGAARFHEQALALLHACGDQRGIAIALTNLGDLARRQEQHTRAAAWYAESLALRHTLDDRTGITFLLESLAALMTTSAQAAAAVRLLGAAHALRETLAMPLPPANHAAYWQTVNHARTQLDSARFATCWSAGEVLTLDDAVEEALAHSHALAALHASSLPTSM